jgi:hypothetical protein
MTSVPLAATLNMGDSSATAAGWNINPRRCTMQRKNFPAQVRVATQQFPHACQYLWAI